MSFNIENIKKTHDNLRKKLISKVDSSGYSYPRTDDLYVCAKLVSDLDFDILKTVCEYVCDQANSDYDEYWDSQSLFNYMQEGIVKHIKGDKFDSYGSFGALSTVLALLSYLSACSKFIEVGCSFIHDKWEDRGDYYAPTRVGLRLVDGNIKVGIFNTDSLVTSYWRLISIAVFDSELARTFQNVIDKYGKIPTSKDISGGISVNGNCITITAPLKEIDPNEKYSINRANPDNHRFDIDEFPKDSQKAKTLANFIKAFELIDYDGIGLSNQDVINSISNAFENEKAIVKVYFSTRDTAADFSQKELIPRNIELNKDNVLIKYTEREEDGGVLICPKCMRGIDPNALTSLKLTKTIVIRGHCELTAGMLEGIECIEKLDMHDLYAEKIPANVFKNCTSLKHVIIPESVYKIENSAFANCTNLSVVSIPESVAQIDETAFENCNNLEDSIKEKISEIVQDTTRFDRIVAERIEYIQTHGWSSYCFEKDSYSSYSSLSRIRKEYEKWHSLYDEYFDTIDRLYKGKFKFVIWSSSEYSYYQKKIEELSWIQAKDISSTTDYLFVDTKNIPGFDRFSQKQRRIDIGDLQGAAVFGNNPIEKAIDLKKEGGKIKILELDLLFKLLEKGDFEEIIVKDKAAEIKSKREAEKEEKKENKASQCEEIISSIIVKSKERGSLFTNSEIISVIEESKVPLTRFEKYVSEKYEKTVTELFKSLGVLKTVESEFNSLIALLKDKYKDNPKLTTVTELTSDNPDLDLSIVINNSKKYTGLSTLKLLIEEGILANEPVKSFEQLTEGVLYKPGNEPADIKRRLDILFPKLDGAYPDKVISGLNKDHKKWGETVTDLYRKLGYKSSSDFLCAYGYTIKDEKNGRPSTDVNAVIEELKKRYPNGSPFTSVAALQEQNPDISGKIKSVANKSTQLFGMSLTKYLKEIGILGGGLFSEPLDVT